MSCSKEALPAFGEDGLKTEGEVGAVSGEVGPAVPIPATD